MLPVSGCGPPCLGPERLPQCLMDSSPAADSAFSSGVWNDEMETTPGENTGKVKTHLSHRQPTLLELNLVSVE